MTGLPDARGLLLILRPTGAFHSANGEFFGTSKSSTGSPAAGSSMQSTTNLDRCNRVAKTLRNWLAAPVSDMDEE
jgi:hypothetical protein